jgi:hypothetical protein
MFGFLYSIAIYACVRMCVIQFIPKALCCLLIRAYDAQIADVQSDKRHILRGMYRLESSSSPLRSYTEYFLVYFGLKLMEIFKSQYWFC